MTAKGNNNYKGNNSLSNNEDGIENDYIKKLSVVKGQKTPLKLTIKDTIIKGILKIKNISNSGKEIEGIDYEIVNANNGKVIQRLTTNSKGEIQVVLPYGKYIYKQIKTPKEYMLDSNERKFNISEEGQVIKENVINSMALGGIQINKMDSANNLPLEGATFEILDSSGKVVETETTNAQGQIIINNLPIGQYTCVETSPPPGYIIAGMNSIPFYVAHAGDMEVEQIFNVQITGSLEITKIDEQTSQPLEGATFEVFTMNGDLVQGATTNAQGKLTISNLAQGQYIYVETIAPDGYVLNSNIVEFTISSNGQVISKTIPNQAIRGSISITKVAANTKEPLEGAKFEVLNSSGNVVGTGTTNNQGEVTIGNLLVGNYTYVETVAPTGYVLNSVPGIFNISTNGQVVQENVINSPIKGSFSIIKIDFVTKKPLQGATFQILNSSGEIVQTETTNAQGELTVSNLIAGTYTYMETIAPLGYVLDNTKGTFSITKNGQSINKTLTNEQIMGSLLIIKSNSSGDMLEGATFEVLNSSGKIVGTGTTNSQGEATISDIPYGNYNCVETAAPEGYILDNTPIVFSIATNGQVVKENVVNVPIIGSLIITKINITTKAPLSGATFQILNSSGTVVQTETTSSNGQIQINNLPYGNYTCVETIAPIGYVLNNTPIEFAITTNGQVVNKTVTNTLESSYKGSLQINKIDAITHKPLSGANFKIIDSSGTIIQTGVTDNQGELTVSDLPLGNYTYVETVAPEGYILNNTPVSFSIRLNGQTVVEQMGNTLAEGSLQITKVDETTNAPLSGATFQVLNSSGQVVETETTNEDGQLTVSNLTAGTYTYVETVAPVGYVLDNTPSFFSITTNGQVIIKTITNQPIQGSLLITKIGENNEPLKGATFEVLNSSGKIVGTGTTNIQGQLIIGNLIVGNYTYVETVAPNGYVLDSTPGAFSITTNDEVVSRKITNQVISGSLSINKIDLITGKPLPGATFQIFNSQGTLIQTSTTNAKGQLTISNLTAGNYIYLETIAPNGYVLDNTKNTFSITTNGQIISKTITNQPIQGSLSIIKTEANSSNLLEGATFEVLNSSGKVVGSGTTNAQGQLTISNLLAGNYTYVETTAPTGYVLDNTPVTFSITADGQNVNENIVNQPIMGSLLINKTDSVTKSPLAGATFQILNSLGQVIQTETTDSQGKIQVNNLPAGKYTYVEIIAPIGYDLNNIPVSFSITTNSQVVTENISNQLIEGSLLITKVDANTQDPLQGVNFEILNSSGKVVETGTTNAQGELTINNLKAGTYTYLETSVPNGYVLDSTPVAFSITSNGQIVSEKVLNQVIQGSLQITKVDETTNAPLEGSTFEILNSSGSIVQTETTNAKGQITVNNLPYGNYTYAETVAPVGYILDNTPVPFSITINGEMISKTVSNVLKAVIDGALQITKLDGNTQKLLSGASFKVLNSHGVVVGEGITDAQGKLTINNLPQANYTNIEIEAPVGYILDSTPQPFSITESGEIIQEQVLNYPAEGSLSITKIDSTTAQPLEGATFEILNSSGTIVQTGITNSKGELIISNLTAGNYTYVETVAPVGYMLDNTPVAFSITTNNEVVTKTITNQAISGAITITKSNSLGNMISGATFEILNSSGIIVQTGTTNAQGQLTIDNLPYGNYTCVETVAPTGYVLDSKPIAFMITTNGQVIKENIVNQSIIGSLSITKVNITTKEPLVGATFQILNSSGTVVQTETTGSNGQITVNNLPYGNYTYIETVAPTGYVLNNTPVAFSIKTNGQVVNQTVTNTLESVPVGSLQITKIDSTTSKPLSGATFEVLDSSGTVVQTGTTNAKGELTINNLPYGNYTYVETVAPTGYVLDSNSVPFSIRSNGQVVVEQIRNILAKGSLQIIKLDATTNAPLEGATFQVLNSLGEVVETETTNVDGQLTVSNLEAGNYTYVETVAPAGYVLNSTPESFSITTNNEIISKTITNQPIQGSLSITKLDTNKNLLKGATFQVLNSSGKVVGTGTTNIQGQLTISNLVAGSYTYVETVAPTGYVLDSTPGAFSITTNGEVVSKQIINKIITGEILISKIDSITSKPLAGATFEILNSSGQIVQIVTTNTKGQLTVSGLTYGKYTYVEIVAPTGYVLDSTPVPFSITTNGQVVSEEVKNVLQSVAIGSFKVLKTDAITKLPLAGATFQVLDSSGKVVGTGTTNSQGEVVIGNLPGGNYTSIETKAPDGYIRYTNSFAFSIVQNGEVIEATVADYKVTGTLQINKTDSKTKAPLAGATFQIVNSLGQVIHIETTNSKGQITISNLEAGNYTYVEIVAPYGYVLDNTPVPFSITTYGQVITENISNQLIEGSLLITKVEANTQNPLQGAYFEVLNSSGKVVGTGVTGTNGQVTISNLAAGNYTCVETAVPTGYVLDSTPLSFSITSNGQIVSERIVNEVIEGSIKITKVDEKTNLPLSGATFQILNSSGTVIQTETTNAKGQITVNNLPYGKYTYVEVEAPAGYILNNTPVSFSITTNGEFVNKTVPNTLGTISVGSLQITKIDGSTQKFLMGAEFKILNSQGTVVGQGTTNSDGQLTVNSLPVGVYTSIEIQAPTGYISDSTPVPFSISEGGQVVMQEVPNYPAEGSLSITKIDKNTSQPLAGATFQVLNSSGKVVGSGVTNSEGELTISNLIAGDYTYVETIAPIGYVLDDIPVSFSITTNGQMVSRTITNESIVGSLSIKKSNIATVLLSGKSSDENSIIEALAGATFQVLNSSGKIVGSGVTNSEGILIINDLPYGNYTCVETEAPVGYVLDNKPIAFSITTNGQVVKESVIDKQIMGLLSITKINITNKAPLSGATFQILNSSGTVVQTETTDSNGQIIVNNLPYGNYTYVETVAPVGYVLNNTPVPFSIKTNGQLVSKTVTNTLASVSVGTLQITKIDSTTSKPLEGSTFEVLDSSEDVVQTGTTNEEGKLIISNLPLGNYTYVETVAPTGYILNNTPVSFSIRTNGQVVVEQVANILAEGSLQIIKVDETTNAPLEGATFQVLNSLGEVVETETTNSDGKLIVNNLIAGNYTYVETIAPMGYVLNNIPVSFSITTNKQVVSKTITNKPIQGSLVITKISESGNPLKGATFEVLDSSGKVVETGTTNIQGQLSIDNLVAGNYTYVETVAPSGYVLDNTPGVFSITTNGEVISKQIINQIITGSLSINKIDSVTNKPLSGATFEVLNSSGQIVKIVTTNAQGQLNVSGLSYGNYTYVEIVAPQGYVLDSTPVSFSISTNGQVVSEKVTNVLQSAAIGSFKIIKTDAITKLPLSGATFEVLNSSGKVVGIGITNAQGEVVIGNLPGGNYTSIETQAPKGYRRYKDSFAFSIVQNGQVIEATVADYRATGTLQINKIDAITKVPLEGATFQILNSLGQVIYIETTNEQGQIIVSNIPSGNYTYVETVAPPGYVLNSTPVVFSITSNGQVITRNITNQLISGTLSITKVDSVTRKTLQGVEFQVLNSSGTIVGTGTTNSQGQLTIGNLPYGNYTYVETVVPVGYELNSTPVPFSIRSNGEIVEEQIINNLIKGSLQIIKVDSINKSPLEGATFQVLNSKGEVIQTEITNSQGKLIITDLPYGSYTCVEISAPIGYVLDDTQIYFEINFNGQTITKEIYNTPITGEVIISKVDSVTGEYLSGGYFEIKNSNGILIKKFEILSLKPQIINLLPGSYILTEVTAPLGYIPNSTVYQFIIPFNPINPVILTIKNLKELYSVVLRKIDSTDDSKLLEGAEFEILNTDGQVVGKISTGTEGTASLKLPLGTYTVKEVKVPKGYFI